MATQSSKLTCAAPLTGLTRLDAVQAIVAVAALVPCLQGRPGTPKWLLLAVSLPTLRFLLVCSYRRRVLAWLGRLWDSLEGYPVQTERPPWLAVVIFVVLPHGLLLLSREYAFQAGDSRPVILSAARLVTRGETDITEYVELYQKKHQFTNERGLPYFAKRTESGTFSGYPSGMVPFALPVTAAARLLYADLNDVDVHARLEKWTAAWIAAACLGLFFLLALHLAAPKPAWAASLFLAIGSVLFTTVGQALWQHDGVIFWSLLGLWLEFRHARRPSAWGTALQGLACAMLIACRLSSVLFVLPFVAWVLIRTPRRAVALAACAVVAYLPWAAWYQSIYGNPLGPSTMQMAEGNWPGINPSSLAGVLVSPSRGVLTYQPWLMLAGVAVVPAIRRCAVVVRSPSPAGWFCFCLVVCICHVVLIGSWGCWWGGYCWGSRLAAEIVPLAALLCVRPIAAVWLTVNGRRLVLAFAVLAGLLHVPAVFLKQDRWNSYPSVGEYPDRLWSWTDAPFLFSESRHRLDLPNHKSAASRERERPE